MASIISSLVRAAASASNSKNTNIVANETVLLYDISSNNIIRNGFNITEKTVKIKDEFISTKPVAATINSKLKTNNTHTEVVDDRIVHILNITDILYSTQQFNTANFIHTINDMSDLGLAILNKIASNEKTDVIRQYGLAGYNDISNSLIFNESININDWQTKDIQLLNTLWDKLSQFIPEINEPFPNVSNAFIEYRRLHSN